MLWAKVKARKLWHPTNLGLLSNPWLQAGMEEFSLTFSNDFTQRFDLSRGDVRSQHWIRLCKLMAQGREKYPISWMDKETSDVVCAILTKRFVT